MDEVLIGYFLEDRAQEGFIQAVVKRVATEESFALSGLSHSILSSQGGSRVKKDFKDFAESFQMKRLLRLMLEAELVVVAIDGDCTAYQKKAQQLSRYIKVGNPLADKAVYAIPDPHIERWYLLDQTALFEAIGVTVQAPHHKCGKDYYKSLLRTLLRNAGIESLLGGPEMGELIVEKMDLYEATKEDHSFKQFIEDLRSRFRLIRQLRGI